MYYIRNINISIEARRNRETELSTIAVPHRRASTSSTVHMIPPNVFSLFPPVGFR